MVGDAGAFLVPFKDDTDGKWPLADDRLIGPGHGDEIAEIDGIALRRGAPLADDDRVECDPHGVRRLILAFEVGLAQHPVKCDVVRAPLRRRAEYRGVGERPQHDRRSGKPQPVSTMR